MDSLVIKKIFDFDVIGFDIVAKTDDVRVEIETYEFKNQIKIFADKICEYSCNPKKECVAKISNFKMKLLPMNKNGHVVTELEMEIGNDRYDEFLTRKSQKEKTHKCSFYMLTDIQSIDDFGRRMKGIMDGDIGYEVTL